jgi:hypothetical protein
MEPFTSIATSLALGAGAIAGKEFVSAVVKDAYATLKQLIKSRYPAVSVDQLEKAPQSERRRGVVEEDLAEAKAEDDAELLAAASKLLRLITSEAPSAAAAIGVQLQDVEAANIRLSGITSSGSGVTIARTKALGDIEIRDVRAGARSVDPSGR